jgi:hypothetical protein
MERINIRLLSDPSPAREGGVAAAIPEFHRWIQHNVTDEMLIDVVDYRHVPDGPGVVLIGHEADYSLNGTGLTYSRKIKHSGSEAEKILDAYNRAAEAARRFGLTWSAFEVIVNDRIGTPNTDENWQALRAVLLDVFGPVGGKRESYVGQALSPATMPGLRYQQDTPLEVTRQGEPRSRLTARVTSKTNLVDWLPRQTAAAH